MIERHFCQICFRFGVFLLNDFRISNFFERILVLRKKFATQFVSNNKT